MGWWKRGQKPQQNSSSTNEESIEEKIDAGVYANLLIREIMTSISSAIEAGKPLSDAMAAYCLNVQNLETLCEANDWLDESNLANYELIKDSFYSSRNIEKGSRLSIELDYALHRKKFGFLLKEVLAYQMKYFEDEI